MTRAKWETRQKLDLKLVLLIIPANFEFHEYLALHK